MVRNWFELRIFSNPGVQTMAFKPLKEVFEPLGIRNQLSGVQTLFTEFDRFRSSKPIRVGISIYFKINLV